MKIKIINKSGNELPNYATVGSAGMDLRANLKDEIIIEPTKRKMIPTGIFIELPISYEAQIRPRSGLAVKFGVTVMNSPGTIDSDYRGEIGVCLINHGDSPFVVNNGDRIAQMVIAKHEIATIIETEDLSETVRGTGGFGHTGRN